jgi:hypothetical protein
MKAPLRLKSSRRTHRWAGRAGYPKIKAFYSAAVLTGWNISRSPACHAKITSLADRVTPEVSREQYLKTTPTHRCYRCLKSWWTAKTFAILPDTTVPVWYQRSPRWPYQARTTRLGNRSSIWFSKQSRRSRGQPRPPRSFALPEELRQSFSKEYNCRKSINSLWGSWR